MKEYFKSVGKDIRIEFSKFFSDKDLVQYEKFIVFISKRKTYGSLVEEMVKKNNGILNLNTKIGDAFIYKYLTLKKEVEKGIFDNKEDLFRVRVLNELFNDDIMDLIVKYVDMNYKTEINNEYELNMKKYEEGSMFLERHYKILYQVSMMSNLSLPMLVNFVDQRNKIYKMDQINISNYIYEFIIHLFKVAETLSEAAVIPKHLNIKGDEVEHKNVEKIDVYNKLYKMVKRKLDSSLHTNKVGFQLQKKYGVTEASIMSEIMVKILTTILPKFSFEGDIIKFIFVVIKTHIDEYVLRRPFTYQAFPTIDDPESEGADGESDRGLFNSFNNKKDEFSMVVKEFISGYTIGDIEILYEIDYEEGEIEYYQNTLEKNELQELLILQIFAKDFSGMENITGCNKIMFNQLCMILSKRMRRHGLNLLADYLLSNKTSSLLQRYQLKSVTKNVTNHPLFEEFLEKYSDVKELFVKKMTHSQNPVIQAMLLILNNNYSNNTFGSLDNGKVLEKNEIRLIEELLTLYLGILY